MSKEIKAIIERTRDGNNPTLEERNKIQHWIEDTIVGADSAKIEIIEDIQVLFSEEYDNAIDEKDEDLMVGSYLGTYPKSHMEDAMEDDHECEEILDSFLETCPNCHQDYDPDDYDLRICHYCWWDAKNKNYTKKQPE